MLKKILIVLALLLVVLVIVIARKPDDFVVRRDALVNAPPAAVFAQVNDFHKWEAWSPWAKIDPNSKATYEGAESGVGAGFTWDGNNDVGAGRMDITESKPNERIVIRLEFFKPMPGVNTTEFTFKPEGAGTRVTWTMSGKNNFVAKAFGLFFDCDKMVGGQFEKGLASLDEVSKAATPK